MQRFERIDRVTNATAVELHRRDDERRLSAGRQPQHIDPPHSVGQIRIPFMRRHRGRHEPHLIQPKLLPATLRQQQMPIMNRIKCAAEQTEEHGEGARD